MNELQDFPISVNAYEAGYLMGLIMERKEEEGPLKRFFQQLIELKMSIEAADGIIKKLRSDGLIELTDIDGVTIVREPFPWEIKELTD